MASTLTLDILTPTGPKREGVEVSGVEVPGIEGELGVLPHHESLVTAIVPGVIRFREGNKSTRIAVGAGFLEVKQAGRVIVLVERALEPDEIDVDKARSELGPVEAKLKEMTASIADPEYQRLDTERAWLEAQIRTATA